MTDVRAAPLPLRMGRLSLIFIGVVVVAVGLGRALADPGADNGRLVGTTAPEVVVDRFDGSTWRLSDSLGGGPVVLNLWASYCPPCLEEIPELSRFASTHPGVVVVGAAVRDDVEDAKRFADQLAPSYVIGMDATERLRDALPTVGLPSTFVIDGSGTIVAQFERQVTAEDLEAATR